MSIAEFNYSTLITLSCSSLNISFNWSFSVLISVPTFFFFFSCKWWKQMIQFLSMMTSEFSFASAKIILVETRFHILNMLSSFLTWKYIKESYWNKAIDAVNAIMNLDCSCQCFESMDYFPARKWNEHTAETLTENWKDCFLAFLSNLQVFISAWNLPLSKFF